MEFSFWLIYDFLEQENPYIVSYHSDSAKIRSVRLWNGNLIEHDNILYVVSGVSFDELIKLMNILPNILLLGRTMQKNLEEMKLSGNLMMIDSLKTSNEIFVELLDTMEEFQSWYMSLLQLSATKYSISKILKVAAEKLKNPIALFDGAASLIEWAGEFREKWDGTIWEPVIEKGYAPAEFYTMQEWREISEKLLKNERPMLRRVVKDPEHPILSLGLMIDNELIGSLGTVEINGPLTQGQIYLIEILRQILILAYGNSKDLIEISKNSAFYFEKIIKGEKVDRNKLYYYLKQRGWEDKTRFMILCMDVKDVQKASIQYLIERIRNLKAPGVFCKNGEELIFIINKKDFDFTEDMFLENLEKVLDGSNIYGIISDYFTEMMELQTIYHQCKAVLPYLREEAKHLGMYKTYYAQDISDALCLNQEPGRWCHPLLYALFKKTNEMRTDWIYSLYIYLLNGRNITKAAKALYMHRNSLAYRLGKIFEYLGIDSENMDERTIFQLLLSCMLLLEQKDR